MKGFETSDWQSVAVIVIFSGFASGDQRTEGQRFGKAAPEPAQTCGYCKRDRSHADQLGFARRSPRVDKYA